MEFIKDLSVVIGLWVLFYKIAAWHLEHRGRRNIELAEETLALFYEAKDVIGWMRSPMSFSTETDSVKEEGRETKEQFEARKKASVIFVRYNQNKELFNKIHSLRYRFMAQIGKEKAKPFEDLNKIVKEIISSARLLAILWPERHFTTEEAKKKHYEQIRKTERVFWDTFSEDDPINPKIDKLMADIEEVCKSVIMAKGTLHGLLNWPIKK
ncbi:MAG: hypothetical protein KKD11_06360 [Candidatus Omnitrophica bacterium]|nr:hypothetical protein [Candidatus Omnitrophota bacterium]